MGLTWDQIDGVMKRAVRRGLARRNLEAVHHVGVDETPFVVRVLVGAVDDALTIRAGEEPDGDLSAHGVAPCRR
jgi:hypothetical protein